jgi:hypothetical protein
MTDLPLIPSSAVGSHGKPGWRFDTVKAYEADCACGSSGNAARQVAGVTQGEVER